MCLCLEHADVATVVCWTSSHRLILARPSTSSAAANFRAGCGPKRTPPECSTHCSPGAAPHVEQETDINWLGVSSFAFIPGCYGTPGQSNCSILNYCRNL